jgi:hemolysin activation/secretion protein
MYKLSINEDVKNDARLPIAILTVQKCLAVSTRFGETTFQINCSHRYTTSYAASDVKVLVARSLHNAINISSRHIFHRFSLQQRNSLHARSLHNAREIFPEMSFTITIYSNAAVSIAKFSHKARENVVQTNLSLKHFHPDDMCGYNEHDHHTLYKKL